MYIGMYTYMYWREYLFSIHGTTYIPYFLESMPGHVFPLRLRGPGVQTRPVFIYCTFHAHSCYAAHAEVEIQFSSCDCMASQGSDRHPLSLPRGACGLHATPPSWYRAKPASNRGLALICYTALNTPGV